MCRVWIGAPSCDGAGAEVHEARPVGADHEVRLLLRERRELVVSHGDRDLGELHAEEPAEPAATLARGPVDGLAPRHAIEQRERVIVTAELAQHVARVVVRDPACLGDVHRWQVTIGEKLCQLLCARGHGAGACSRFVIADHLEQLWPEDPDHRGARPRRHDDRLAVGLAQRVECRPRDLGRFVGEARVPRRLAATRLSGGHVDLASRGTKHLHRVDAGLGLEEVDETRDEQRDAHGSTVAG